MALWAQLASVVELVAGVALAGVGTGVAVYVARTRRSERQRELLREAIRLGLASALPVAGVVVLGGMLLEPESPSMGLIGLAAAAGWLAVVPGVVNGYWLGQQRRGPMLALAVAAATVSLLAALLAPASQALWFLCAAQAAPALVVLFLRSAGGTPRFRRHSHPLRRYVIPGLAIGILSPASLLVARGIVGDQLSWHDAGVLQALWRISDWVGGFAAGVLTVYFLPRFAAAGSVGPEMRRAAKLVVLPAFAVFVLLLAFHQPLLQFLYGPQFVVSTGATLLVFAGSLVRVASWIPLFALYARHRTRAITVGELFSLPLFAALLALLGERLSLELAGAMWLASYAAYLAFNLLALRR